MVTSLPAMLALLTIVAKFERFSHLDDGGRLSIVFETETSIGSEIDLSANLGGNTLDDIGPVRRLRRPLCSVRQVLVLTLLFSSHSHVV